MTTHRQYRLSDDIIDALLLTGRATATITIDDTTEHIELVADPSASVLNAIYRTR